MGWRRLGEGRGGLFIVLKLQFGFRTMLLILLNVFVFSLTNDRLANPNNIYLKHSA